MSVRLRRLYADYQRVSQVFEENPYIQVKSATGSPPERYQIEYRIRGLEQKNNNIIEKSSHLVEVMLPRDYPSEAPQCRMLTPVFHPNIAPHAVCIGDHWTAGESLADLIVRIGEMISYQSYNIKSPLNGEAAKWADENIHRLPIDSTDLTLKKRPEEVIVTKIDIKETGNEDTEDKNHLESGKSIVESALQIPLEACSNCGKKGEGIYLQKCLNGHLVCLDCVIECQRCGKTICVQCSFVKCTICEKLLCAECQTKCSACNQPVCKEHLAKCNVCQNEGCPQCISTCPKCQKSLCKLHFNRRENCCTKCVTVGEERIVISYEELKNSKTIRR